jgi:hypothetical protein
VSQSHLTTLNLAEFLASTLSLRFFDSKLADVDHSWVDGIWDRSVIAFAQCPLSVTFVSQFNGILEQDLSDGELPSGIPEVPIELAELFNIRSVTM